MNKRFQAVRNTEISEWAELIGWIIIGPLLLVLLVLLSILALPALLADRMQGSHTTRITVAGRPALFYGIVLKHYAIGAIKEDNSEKENW